MKTRFIQRWREGDKVYLPGVSADHLSKTRLKKLINEGVVAVMAQPEVENKEPPEDGDDEQ